MNAALPATARAMLAAYEDGKASPSDSGVYRRATTRSSHGPEDATAGVVDLVRAPENDRTEADPYEAEATRLLNAALERAGATKADLARALGKKETWARKLTDPDASPTLSFGGFFRLHESAPALFKAIQDAIAALHSPPPRRAPTVAEQRKILARRFAEVMAADDGVPARKAARQLREALDGYEDALAKEGSR